jgi:hypothetical protein
MILGGIVGLRAILNLLRTSLRTSVWFGHRSSVGRNVQLLDVVKTIPSITEQKPLDKTSRTHNSPEMYSERASKSLTNISEINADYNS